MFVKRASNKLDGAHLTIAFLFGLNTATLLPLFLFPSSSSSGLLMGQGCNTYQIMHALLLPSRNCPDPVESSSPFQLIYAIFVDANFLPKRSRLLQLLELIQVLRKERYE